MKVVVSFDEDQFGAAGPLLTQLFQQRHEGGEDAVPVAEPELEDVAEHDQVADTAPLLLQKGQQPLIVAFCRVEQVGVCNKEIFHGAQI